MPGRDEITQLSLAAVSNAIRRRELGSLEVTQACLLRIEELQPHIRCFINVEAEQALAAARKADSEIARQAYRGPLHGVPFAYKDLFHRRGQRTTAGSNLFTQPSPETATVIERLDMAGAVQLGTLNLDELAASGTGMNPHFGDCRNPWNADVITGGSSSGTAAAVAARLVYGAFGTDTGGSIRLPAALCGVTALKPTYGRVSRFGVFPRSWSCDCVGPGARSVEDCAIILSTIAGPDSRDSTTSRLPVPPYTLAPPSNRPLRIGIAVTQFAADAHLSVQRAIADAAATFRALGFPTTETHIDGVDMLNDLQQVVVRCEAAALHGRVIRERRHDVSPNVIDMIEDGLMLPASRYIEALALRPQLLSAFVHEVFSRVDAIIVPTALQPPERVEDVRSHRTSGAAHALRKAARCLRFANYLGLPALALPCGFTDEDLPLGLQIIAPPFHEETLIRLGTAYQRATQWHLRYPQL